MKLFHDLKKSWKIILAAATVAVAVLVFLPIIFYTAPPMPPGTSVASAPVAAAPEDLRLLIDDTAWDPEGERRVIRQEIFDEMLAMIRRADQFIYVDLFLWNPWQGSIPEEHRKLSSELAEALLEKKRSLRGLDVLVLTDPINRIYGGMEPAFFKDMAKAGIPVVFTDLDRLPDSNSLYAPYWSFIEKVLDINALRGWAGKPRFPNPFQREGAGISALQLGRLLRFKANHRKVIITGSTRHGLEMLAGSLNPADGSSAHSNLALAVRGGPVLGALETELAALRWSIERKRNVIVGATSMASFKADSIERKAREIALPRENPTGKTTAQWLTEGAVADAVIRALENSGTGDTVRIAMFYLSERRVVKALRETVLRGASVRVILDANRDAFGMRKIGIPNRPVAAELMRLSRNHDVAVRWADTHAEQFHTKAMSIAGSGTGPPVFIAGSANWTRRNIGGYNMEADLLIRGDPGVTGRFNAYFDRIFDNGDGLSHTLPYEAWQEKGPKRLAKALLYRFQERFGAGTF